jgi:two-component system response regulator TtrR
MSLPQQIVFIVDQDERVQETLHQLMEQEGWLVRVYSDAEQFLKKLPPAAMGCVILETQLPGMSGLQLQEKLLNNKVPLPVIIITAQADVPTAVQAMRMGAVDFMEKPVDKNVLTERVRQAMAMDAANRINQLELSRIEKRLKKLTPREYEVMELIIHGMSNKETATRLGLSTKTVEIHRSHIMRKMEADSLANLVQQALTYKLLLKGYPGTDINRAHHAPDK